MMHKRIIKNLQKYSPYWTADLPVRYFMRSVDVYSLLKQHDGKLDVLLAPSFASMRRFTTKDMHSNFTAYSPKFVKDRHIILNPGLWEYLSVNYPSMMAKAEEDLYSNVSPVGTISPKLFRSMPINPKHIKATAPMKTKAITSKSKKRNAATTPKSKHGQKSLQKANTSSKRRK